MSLGELCGDNSVSLQSQFQLSNTEQNYILFNQVFHLFLASLACFCVSRLHSLTFLTSSCENEGLKFQVYRCDFTWQEMQGPRESKI